MNAEVWLPEAADDESRANEAAATRIVREFRKFHVLLVDDDTLARDAVEALLVEMGHAVAPVSSAADALTLLRNEQFDLIIADVLMPDMRGDELAALANAELPSVPVLLLTGHPGELSEEARKLPIVSKPVSKKILMSALEDVIDA